MAETRRQGGVLWPGLGAAAVLLLLGFVGPVWLALVLSYDSGVVRAARVAALVERFAARDYPLDAPVAGRPVVPRIYLESLPRDWRSIDDPEARKRAFVKTVLPLVLRVNERIRETRARLERLAERAAAGERLERRQRRWLERLAERYRAQETDPQALLRRVDVVPPSLAVAQAAIESGWGTSRFARKANALFGQWTWDAEAEGIVPEARAASATHRIKAFEDLTASVAAYMRNLNSHRAYRELRARRAELRRAGKPIDGLALARTLTRYSERGAAYVRDLVGIIRHNDLARLDRIRLAPSGLGLT